MTSMTTAILVLRLFAASQVLLLVTALAISPNPLRTRLLGVALALAAVSYLLSSQVFDYINFQIGPGLGLLADVIPPLLFFFTWELFEDDRRPPIFVWLIAALYLGVASWFGLTMGLARGEASIFFLAPLQLTKLGFAVGAIYVVWRGREDDVVESRLKLRRVFAAGIGVTVAVVVMIELIMGWHVPTMVELIGMAAIFGVTLAINLAFLRFNPTFVLVASRSLQPLSSGENPLVDELKKIMSDGQTYTDHNLRIADLAARLKVPEYQLRRTINRSLGYQNFNQFVNRYRVEEAACRLMAEPRTQVLTIALDVGFRSISSFNTAFRAQYQMTPTDYRRNTLVDS